MIWLIGYKGMLGSEVAKQLEENNLYWIGTGSEVDITDYQTIKKFIFSTETNQYYISHTKNSNPQERKISWIINCAAYTAVDKAEDEKDKAELLNSKACQNLARIARSHGSKLIHISTDYVFDGNSKNPYKENDVKNPTGIYGKTKSDGENFIISSMTQYYILRTSWLYGFDGKNFVYTMTNLFNTKNEVKVVDDQIGSPTSCVDLAKIILMIIQRSQKSSTLFGKNSTIPYGVYHVSNEGQTSWFEFAKKIYEFAKKYNKISNECVINPCSSQEFNSKAPRPKYSVLDKSKISKELRIKIPSWEQSLKEFFINPRFKN